MKSGKAIRGIAGVLLCAGGLCLALPTRYKEQTYSFNAHGCGLDTTMVQKLLFHNPPKLPSNSLVMAGSLELESMRGNAADLVAAQRDATAKYLEIPGASHVSILFSGAAMRPAQEWAAQVLHTSPVSA